MSRPKARVSRDNDFVILEMRGDEIDPKVVADLVSQLTRFAGEGNSAKLPPMPAPAFLVKEIELMPFQPGDPIFVRVPDGTWTQGKILRTMRDPWRCLLSVEGREDHWFAAEDFRRYPGPGAGRLAIDLVDYSFEAYLKKAESRMGGMVWGPDD